ncbi:hypothetical protein [Pseudomonas syringae]|uniref:hypothetical protein n=1 Tax=Pseudomonas syringae TaxID=317 RepID=UPI000BB5C216|nr:hypothetical protein [Pseudomonas syringae]PBP77044.1 hypothetical protein CCL22_24690 [Pseudomonas syringae]PBP78554.1 hypothetical protein CCL22_19780 [Pseudomonas syringae]POP71914.1 hypothetical protein CXB37_27420 [Pseudomonas syringae pv. syringae]
MQDHVLKRIDELISRGNAAARSQSSQDYWVKDVVEAQSWFSSAANAIHQVAPPGSFYMAELQRIVEHEHLKGGFPKASIEKLLGLLQSVQHEAQAGLLVKLEDQVVASAFDDFLDHATLYHKGGKLNEAAVLASAVLEDTIKRIARKNEIAVNGVSLDPLIDELTKRSVFTQVKAKRLKSYAAVRNHALHAEWEKLDLRDVGAQLSGLRELLDEHL